MHKLSHKTVKRADRICSFLGLNYDHVKSPFLRGFYKGVVITSFWSIPWVVTIVVYSLMRILEII